MPINYWLAILQYCDKECIWTYERLMEKTEPVSSVFMYDGKYTCSLN